MAISREEGRATSDDGGKTWSRPTAIHGVDGQVINGRASYHTILRLKSGALGGFSSGNAPTSGPYSLNEYFSRSEDEGKTWSRPVRVGSLDAPGLGRSVFDQSQRAITISLRQQLGAF